MPKFAEESEYTGGCIMLFSQAVSKMATVDAFNIGPG
jgi:hypothetical protein